MKIILMGEPMGLFMANETGSLSEVNGFTASIAGAEYNVAVGLARLGHTPAYCTRLGFDPLGERILRGMRQNGIATDLVMQTEEALTGFMMKAFTQKGDPDIAYYRKGSAASAITPHDIDKLDLYGCERLHVTGIFPAVSESALAATKRLIQRAQALELPYSLLFSTQREEKCLSSRTIMNCHLVISIVLGQAEKEMRIPLNPAHRASPPKREAHDPNYFQMEEVGKILRALEAEPIKWRAAGHLLLGSGCRRGGAFGPEVGPCGLGKWADPH